MGVIARKPLVEFSFKHPDASIALEAWYRETEAAAWTSSVDIKTQYHSASVLNRRRVVFNICGNKFRLVVDIHYLAKLVYIRFVGTHKEYNRIDAESI